MLWTAFTTKEYPPDDMVVFRKLQKDHAGVLETFREIARAWREMPQSMGRLGIVQLLTFMGLFCMWLYFGVAVAHNIFGADSPDSPAYRAGIEWGGLCSATYNAVCFAFSFVLPGLARKFGRKHTHTFCLLCGAAGLMSVILVHSKYMLLLSMVGVGVPWASTLSMPYAILAAILPPGRTGVYMGIFNFFVVVPEILAALSFGLIMVHFLHNKRMLAVVVGGACMLVAALLMQRVKDPLTLSVMDIWPRSACDFYPTLM